MKVVVVGAGMAGLAAADRLNVAGCAVTVLEARQRLGGRTHTVQVGHAHVDAGATWIHHPIGNPLTEAADQRGLVRSAFDVDRLMGWQALVDGITPDAIAPDGETVKRVRRIEVAFWEWFDGIVSSRHDTPADTLIEQWFEQFRPGLATDWARFLVENAIETELCAPAAEILASNFTADKHRYGGGDDVIVGGYRQLVNSLAEGLDVRLGWPAQHIECTPTEVRITCQHGRHEVADYAIVTVPLGVLKRRSISFEPPLHATRTDAIDRLGFGVFEKVILQFSSRWWTSNDHATGFFLRGSPVFRYWLDLTDVLGTPTLAAHVAGPPAVGLPASRADRVAAATAELERFFPHPERPTHSYATDWAGDPFTQGGYTRLAPGSDITDIEQLAKPHDRIHFAGEATSSLRYGYADGAFASGIREANQILELTTH